MQAIQIRQFGGEAELQLSGLVPARPGKGEVLVEVKAAGVNYADIVMLRKGQQPLPFVPGFEAAGVVLETGRDVSNCKPGQRVMGTVLRSDCGCYAQQAVMPAWLLMPLPDSLTFQEGAAFPVAFLTAYLALHVFGRLAEGENVLIHAAAGGVGTAAVQLAHAHGARVFATASSDQKLRKVWNLGADVLINYVTEDFTASVKKNTNGAGVDLILESVGGDVFNKSFHCLGPLGRLVSCGLSSGEVPTYTPLDLVQRMNTLTGFSLGMLTVMRPEIIRHSMRALLGLLAQGKIHPVVGHTFRLAEAHVAHELILSRASFGKIVLVA